MMADILCNVLVSLATVAAVTSEVVGHAVKRDDVLLSASVASTNGDQASLPCQIKVKNETGVKVEWFSPTGDQLTSDRGSLNSRFRVDDRYTSDYTLIIDEVHEDDAGVYECRILVNHSLTATNRVQLIVNIPPNINSKTPDTQVRTGSDVTLSCTASGSPPPKITWSLQQQNGSAKQLPFTGAEIKLVSVTRYDAGWYSCTADNDIQPPAVERIRLDVLFAPQLTIPYKEVRQDIGSSASLQCVVSSNPKGEVHWFVDGRRIESTNKKYHIRESPSPEEYSCVLFLEMTNLEFPYFTDYKCVAKNDFGSASAVVSLVAFNNTRGPDIGELELGDVTSGDTLMIVVVVLATILVVTVIALAVTCYFLVKKHQDSSNSSSKASNIYLKHASYAQTGSENHVEHPEELKEILS